MMGYKFNRQKPLLNYIVDFYCKSLNLVIKIDGESHNYKYNKDLKRQKELENMGLFFLRFDDLIVKNNIDNVLRSIEWIQNYEEKSPYPLQRGNYLFEQYAIYHLYILTEKKHQFQ